MNDIPINHVRSAHVVPRKTRHPLVVSYFTPGTPYEAHADKLRKSARRLGLDTQIEPRVARSSWVENCAQKALYIREMRQKTDRPILWVDADAVIKRPLGPLIDTSADFAVVKREGWSFYGGQIFFGTSRTAVQLIDIWCRYCIDYPHIWDQVSLGYAWWDMSLLGPVAALWLKDSIYYKEKTRWLSRLKQRVFNDPAIVHKQESRRSKAEQDVSAKAEYDSYMLPHWWREAAKLDRPFRIDDRRRLELGLW